MTADWAESRLADLCTRVTVGHVGPMRDEYCEDGIPFLRSQNVQPFRVDTRDVRFVGEAFHRKLKKSALTTGDVVVVRTGYPGTAALVPDSLPVANCADLVVITPGPALDGQFLVAVFNSAWGKSTISGRLVGVAQQHFNVTVAKEMRIPHPPIDGQRKVAAVLAAYGELIENNLRRIEILEEMAQAVYREWFVNFRFPGHEDVVVVDSPLGPIPEGWEVSALGDESSVVMGQSPKSEFYNDDGIGLPFHQGVTHFGALFPEHVKYCTVESRIAEAGDTLVSVRAPVGRINVADTRMVIGRGLAAVRSLNDECPGFHYRQMRHVFREEDSMGGGTIYKAITKGDLLGLHWLVPPSDIRAAFEAQERPLFSLIANLTRQIRNLRAIRDLLLPQLVSGVLDVSDLDIDTEWLAS